jgi:hypothetical protein
MPKLSSKLINDVLRIVQGSSNPPLHYSSKMGGIRLLKRSLYVYIVIRMRGG